ncbi:MAG: VOC family protein [Planctomycetes bacterium]|nr:VOC family protein [Planctomycetota bacterium]
MMDTSHPRQIRRPAAAVLLAVFLAVSTRAQPGDRPTSQPSGIDSVAAVGITVADLDRSSAFFREVLTFESVSETRLAGAEFASLHGLPTSATARLARLRLGDEFIELTQYQSPKGRPMPADSRSNDH